MCEISVIVPCWNVEKFVPDCLKSLEAQTFKDFEAIFVDDGSTDNTPKILDDFCEKHEYAKVIHKQNAGQAAARNDGLKIASGKFVYFLDSDDFIDPRMLEITHAALNNSDAEACGFSCKKLKEKITFEKAKKLSNRQIKTAKFQEFGNEGRSGLLLSMFFGWRLPGGVWAWLFRHDSLKKLSTYPDIFDVTFKYAEDGHFFSRLFSSIEKVKLTNLKLYSYRMREGSLVHSKFTESKLKIMSYLEDFMKIVQKEFPEAEKHLRSNMANRAGIYIFKITKNGECSEEKFRKLYQTYKANVRFCVTAKHNPYYIRMTILMYPYVIYAKNKFLRKKKKQTEAEKI